ncbi:MAG: ECF transporter S component [Ignavibacteriales bacterium]
MSLNTRFLTRSAIMIALAVGFQALGLQQAVTGPVINAILLTSVELVGPLSGILIGLITPWAAAVTGIFTGPAPVIPVIVAGNLSLVVVFALTRRLSRLAGGLLAAVAKYLAMTAGIKILLARQIPLKPPIIAAMTLTQLYTAIGGVVLALAVIKGMEAFGPAREAGRQG